MDDNKQMIKRHFKMNSIGRLVAEECPGTGVVVNNAPTNGRMVTCPYCRRVVRTGEVR